MAMENFLRYWKPDAVLLMESELWPNLIIFAAERGVSYAIAILSPLVPMLILMIFFLSSCAIYHSFIIDKLE